MSPAEQMRLLKKEGEAVFGASPGLKTGKTGGTVVTKRDKNGVPKAVSHNGGQINIERIQAESAKSCEGCALLIVRGEDYLAITIHGQGNAIQVKGSRRIYQPRAFHYSCVPAQAEKAYQDFLALVELALVELALPTEPKDALTDLLGRGVQTVPDSAPEPVVRLDEHTVTVNGLPCLEMTPEQEAKVRALDDEQRAKFVDIMREKNTDALIQTVQAAKAAKVDWMVADIKNMMTQELLTSKQGERITSFLKPNQEGAP